MRQMLRWLEKDEERLPLARTRKEMVCQTWCFDQFSSALNKLLIFSGHDDSKDLTQFKTL